MRPFSHPLILMALLVCGLAAPAPGAAAAQTLQALSDRPAAPDFALLNLDGETQRLSDFRGRVVIVNFWATWCPPCRFEMPSMQRAWARLQGEDVMMLAIHVGGNEDKVWTFVGAHDLTFPILLDRGSAVADAWPMRGLPTTFVIDPAGRIAYRAIGGREWDDPGVLETIIGLKN